MMTRTCALELRASSAILMNSVDTGWINDENPLEKAAATAERNHFQVRIGGGGPGRSPSPHPKRDHPNPNSKRDLSLRRDPPPKLPLSLRRRLLTRSTPRRASSTRSCRWSTAASTSTVSS